MALLDRLGRRPPEPDGDGGDPLRDLRVDVETLRQANLARELAGLRERVDRARREAEEHDRRTSGGPCIFCGVSRSYAWSGNPGRVMCGACVDDRWDHADAEHKSLVLNRIVTGDDTVRTYRYGRTAEREVARAGFRWFHETAGARPGGWSRWSYVDIPTVRERAAAPPPEPPPRYTAGDPCPRCGCAYMWTELGSVATVEVPANPDADHYYRDVPRGFGCAGCADYEHLNDVVRRVVGVVPVLSDWVPHDRNPAWGSSEHVDVPERLGVTWYRDSPVRTDGRRVRATLAPFAYLDLAAIRRRAFDLFPHESQWTNRPAYRALHADRGAAQRLPVVPYERDDL